MIRSGDCCTKIFGTGRGRKSGALVEDPENSVALWKQPEGKKASETFYQAVSLSAGAIVSG